MCEQCPKIGCIKCGKDAQTIVAAVAPTGDWIRYPFCGPCCEAEYSRKQMMAATAPYN